MAKYFGPDDLDLLESALGLIPDLTPTALVTKFVREKIGYPIKRIEDFEPYFQKDRVTLDDQTTFTYAQVRRFLPEEFFPIETEQALLCRLLIAFQRGRLSHLLDSTEPVKIEWPQGVSPTILPSPSLTISDLMKLNKG